MSIVFRANAKHWVVGRPSAPYALSRFRRVWISVSGNGWLVLGSWHDEGSPIASPPSISKWEEMKLLYPMIPPTVVAFDDTRGYISADAPEAFDRALADFLAGRPVQGKTGYSLPRTSSRASVMQAVRGAEVEIAYGRPAVNGRKVSGELAPISDHATTY